MARFRRYYIDNALVFITAVTCDRQPLFADAQNTTLLFTTMREVQKIHPFSPMAYAVLPDHLHFLMKTGQATNFSQVMQSVKWDFTRNYKAAKMITVSVSLWQDRFWDHVIRDEIDFSNHMDYIHYNAVKHGYAEAPEKWPASSFVFWADRGYYDAGWGWEELPEIAGMRLE